MPSAMNHEPIRSRKDKLSQITAIEARLLSKLGHHSVFASEVVLVKFPDRMNSGDRPKKLLQ